MVEGPLFHDQLLATKFFPPSSSHPLLPRPHLVSLLNEGRRRKLTLISAPAGFGKTTLVSAWVQSFSWHPLSAPHVAWVSLDESDNDPAQFWAYALTALDRQQAGLCTPLLGYLQTQQAPAPPMRSILQALINILVDRTEQFLLIFDDYHLITEPEIHASLTYLVEHLPPQLHLILVTRADPPLPLSLLRARGEVLEVRTNQLRCSLEETIAFFKEVMGMQLPTDVIQDATARTEGWLVGLYLLGLSLQGNTDPTDLLAEVSGSQRYILDYLMEEVLRRQPPAVQTFLLHTSLLERLSAPLCNAVLQQTDSQEILEYLERANVFVVPLDGQRRWFRYHALFAEALRSRLEQTEGESVSTLHLRASRWYAEQGYRTSATRHAISAQDWPRVADLIEQAAVFIWGSSEHALVRRWLEKLPIEMVRSRPRLCLAYAKTLFMVAPYTTIERWLSDAEMAVRAEFLAPVQKTIDTQAPSSKEQYEQDNVLSEIAASRAIITGYYLGDGHATLALCQEALTHLAEENLLTRAEVAYAQSLAYHSFGDIVAAIQCAREAATLAQAVGDTSSTLLYLSRTAYSLLLHGKLHEAMQLTEQAASLGTTPVGLPHAMVCWASIFHADVLREWNRLDEALDLVLQAVRLSEQTETVVALYLGYTELMRVSLARGEREAACAAFQRAEEILEKTYSPYRRDAYLIVDWVQFWLASGESERAAHWAREIFQQARVRSSFAREREDVARARIVLAQKRPAEALVLLEPLGARAEKQERWSHVIEIKVLQALAHSMQAEEQEAFACLTQALQLAEPEGFIRRFVDEGPQMGVLLARLRNQQRKHGPTSYVDTVLAAFRQDGITPEVTGQRIPGQPLFDPLSEREQEVLHLLVRGDSNQGIAEKLVITIDTVKRHVSNIFSKLGVHTRVQAVARARALGLLSEEW